MTKKGKRNIRKELNKIFELKRSGMKCAYNKWHSRMINTTNLGTIYGIHPTVWEE